MGDRLADRDNALIVGFDRQAQHPIGQVARGTLLYAVAPTGNLVNPFPTGLLKPVGNADGRNAGVGQSISFPDQNARSAYAHQFSFDIQRVLPGNVLVTAGYVASRSRNFLYGTGSVNINQLAVNQFGSNLFDLVPNPFFGRGQSDFRRLQSPALRLAGREGGETSFPRFDLPQFLDVVEEP